jgi:hypothetical protein
LDRQDLPLEREGAGEFARLTLRTDPTFVPNPVARETLTILRDLRRRVRTTAPSLLIAEAVERLHVRAVLAARSPHQASRALANVDALIERARAYGVRGMRRRPACRPLWKTLGRYYFLNVRKIWRPENEILVDLCIVGSDRTARNPPI